MRQIDRFVGIVGLPRSGTTLLTALLDAHPAISLYYEPFNASKQARIPVPRDLDHFFDTVEAHFKIPLSPTARISGFKETSILSESLDWAVKTLDQVAREVPTHAIWIQRNPIHCLLSKIDGARTWWGYPEARFDEQSLAGFLRETGPQIAVMHDLVERHRGTIVRYEALVAEPETILAALMDRLGEPFLPSQLAYHEKGSQPEKVMGDPSMIENPEPVSVERAEKRQREERQYRILIEEILHRSEFCEVREQFARLDRLPAIFDPANDAPVTDPNQSSRTP